VFGVIWEVESDKSSQSSGLLSLGKASLTVLQSYSLAVWDIVDIKASLLSLLSLLVF